MADEWNREDARRRAAERIREMQHEALKDKTSLDWAQVEDVAACILYYLLTVNPDMPVAYRTIQPEHCMGFGSFCGLPDRDKYYLLVCAMAGTLRLATGGPDAAQEIPA